MGFESTTIYTIGTALTRAQANGLPVQVLVEGQWLAGQVADIDGHGLMLEGSEQDHSVVRMQSIAAVRILGEAPHRADARPAPHHEVAVAARSMPGPQRV